MQRRAAAVYFAFFLVVGVAAYSYIGVAQETQRPSFSVEGTTLQADESATIDGTEYTLTDIGHSSGGGGHGGGGGGAMQAVVEWTNESAQQTATVENGSEATVDGETYQVLIASESNVSSFTLREAQNVSAILRNDPAVENSLATRNDTQYVVYSQNDSIRPLSEYLPEPETREVQQGEEITYQGNTTTVAEVTPEAVTLARTAPATATRELSEGGNVTLANGQQYFAHFPDEERVTLAPQGQYGGYAETVDQRHYFDERVNGLWGIVIISLTAAVLLLSAAYLPVRG